MRIPIIAALFILALLSGCATAPRTVSLQTKATAYAATTTARVAEINVSVTDEREDRSLDFILAPEATRAVSDVLRRAVLDAKLATLAPEVPAKWEIHGQLARLDWFVPEYKAMLKKAFATSFLTGGLGGLAYGSTSTPVQGNAVLRLRVVKDGKEVLSREYVGFWEEKTAKLKCDTMDTKSRVAGAALSDAVEKFLKDLDQPQTVTATVP